MYSVDADAEGRCYKCGWYMAKQVTSIILYIRFKPFHSIDHVGSLPSIYKLLWCISLAGGREKGEG
jgi:hypothetical protein